MSIFISGEKSARNKFQKFYNQDFKWSDNFENNGVNFGGKKGCLNLQRFQKFILPASTNIISLETIDILKKFLKEFFFFFFLKESKPKIRMKVWKIQIYQKKSITLLSLCVQKLFDYYFFNWNVIPLHLTKTYANKTFRFHLNVNIEKSLIKGELISSYTSQMLCFDKSIMIEENFVFFSNILNKCRKDIDQFFKTNTEIKNWNQITTKFSLKIKLFFLKATY